MATKITILGGGAMATACSVLLAEYPDQLVAIVVGKEKDFDRPLESAGLPVERVDISIPPPPCSGEHIS